MSNISSSSNAIVKHPSASLRKDPIDRESDGYLKGESVLNKKDPSSDRIAISCNEVNSSRVLTRFLISEDIGVRNRVKYNATAYAVPLHDITVDGCIDDWPEDMIRYPILNYGKTYGPTDIDCADLTKSSDLSPYFMVGKVSGISR